MRCANGGGYLHLHQAMPLYVESPSELLDRIQGSDMVCLQLTQLTFGQSRHHSHLLQNFDSMESMCALHHYF
jgi:hypothetical protein